MEAQSDTHVGAETVARPVWKDNGRNDDLSPPSWQKHDCWKRGSARWQTASWRASPAHPRDDVLRRPVHNQSLARRAKHPHATMHVQEGPHLIAMTDAFLESGVNEASEFMGAAGLYFTEPRAGAFDVPFRFEFHSSPAESNALLMREGDAGLIALIVLLKKLLDVAWQAWASRKPIGNITIYYGTGFPVTQGCEHGGVITEFGPLAALAHEYHWRLGALLQQNGQIIMSLGEAQRRTTKWQLSLSTNFAFISKEAERQQRLSKTTTKGQGEFSGCDIPTRVIDNLQATQSMLEQS